MAAVVIKDGDSSQSILNGTSGNGDWQHNQWANAKLSGGLTEVDGEATTYAANYLSGVHVYHIKPKAAEDGKRVYAFDLPWYAVPGPFTFEIHDDDGEGLDGILGGDGYLLKYK